MLSMEPESTDLVIVHGDVPAALLDSPGVGALEASCSAVRWAAAADLAVVSVSLEGADSRWLHVVSGSPAALEAFDLTRLGALGPGVAREGLVLPLAPNAGGLGRLQLIGTDPSMHEPARAEALAVLLLPALYLHRQDLELREAQRLRREQQVLLQELTGARAELQQTNEQLLESNATLQEFVYASSHDLRQPLRSIGGFAQVLSRRYSDVLDEEGRGYLRYILRGVKRMQVLFDELLRLSRVGSASLEAEEISPGRVLVEVLEGLRESIRDSGGSVRWQRLPKTLYADRSQLLVLLQNLVHNALTYHREGIEPEVVVSIEPDGGGWRVEVSDNGLGIPEARLEDVFGLFRRLHPEDRFPGSGLGLAVARRIAQRHGGRIGARSVDGEGSTFWFTLPGAPADPDPSESG